MSEGTSNSDKKEEIVRFRRWIAMTTDGRWREFRGTPGMVNVGHGTDLVELVDRMMLLRISLFGNMQKGYEQMRHGLTPYNAGWIYSEMVASIESLLKFEISNFTPSNGWTTPKDRSAFPRYLSDMPVLDGNSDQKKHFSEQMRLLCGEYIPRRVSKLFDEAEKRQYENQGDFEGTSEQFLALGKRLNSQPVVRMRPVVPTQDGSCQTETPMLTPSTGPVQATNTRKVCSGVGVSFNASREATVTAMSNEDLTRIITSIPELPTSAISNIPSLLTMYCPPTLSPVTVQNIQNVQSSQDIQNSRNSQDRQNSQDRETSQVSQNSQDRQTSRNRRNNQNSQNNQNNQNNQNSRIRLTRVALVITKTPDGEITSIGYVPIQDPSTSVRIPSPSASVVSSIQSLRARRDASTQRNAEARSRNQRNRNNQINDRIAQVAATVTANRAAVSNQSDSGFSSISDQGNASTRASTPATSTSGTLSPAGVDASTSTGLVEESILETPEDTETESSPATSSLQINLINLAPIVINFEPHNSSEQNTPRGPSYAYVASKTTRTMSTSDRNMSDGASSSNVVMVDDLSTEDKGIKITFSSYNGQSSNRQNEEWVQVKHKNAAVPKPNDTLPPLVSFKPNAKQDTSISTVLEISEVEEVDDEKEEERERKRLKRQKHRAAKAQRDKEEKRMKTNNENGDVAKDSIGKNDGEKLDEEMENAPKLPEASSTEIVHQEQISVEPSVQETAETELPKVPEKVAPKKKETPEPYYDETGKYCDYKQFKVPEAEKLPENASIRDVLLRNMSEHSLLIFRCMWFDTKKILEKVRVDETRRASLQVRLNMTRAMQERVDRAGRIIVYLGANPAITSSRKENMLQIAKNLTDMKRWQYETDMEMARALGHVIAKFKKDLVYKDYIASILALPEDAIPKFPAGDPRISEYKHIVILTQLHVRMVEKLYQELCDLYDFNVVIVPKPIDE